MAEIPTQGREIGSFPALVVFQRIRDLDDRRGNIFRRNRAIIGNGSFRLMGSKLGIFNFVAEYVDLDGCIVMRLAAMDCV